MGEPSELVDVIVSVSDEAREDIEGLARRLTEDGLVDSAVLSSIGLIHGRVKKEALPRLKSNPGVSSVEFPGHIQLSPPDSQIQ